MNLRLYNYNNYYNRMVKRMTTDSAEYSEYVYQIEKANFNPNDNVMTSHIFGNNVSTYSGEADYLVVTDEFNNIQSRWFIIEQKRLRGGQWELTLRHDLIADFYDEILEAPCFIEKAIAADNDIAVYNSENMTFNQIKTSEHKLTDGSQCPWIVGYIDRKTDTKTFTFTPPIHYTNEVETMADLPFYEDFNPNGNIFKAYVKTPLKVSMAVEEAFSSSARFNYITFDASGAFTVSDGGRGGILAYLSKDSDIARAGAEYLSNHYDTILSDALDEFDIVSVSKTNDFLESYPEEGIIYRVNDTGKYYKITRTILETVNIDENPVSNNSALCEDLKKLAKANPYVTVIDIGDIAINRGNFKVALSYLKYSIKIEEVVPNNSYTFTLPRADARTHLLDAPYDMFAIPYNSVSQLLIYKDSVGYIANTNADVGMELANNIIKELGTACYDVQLLPYCPVQSIIHENGVLEIDTEQFVEGTNFNPIVDATSNNPVSIVLFPSKASFSFIIPYNIPVSNKKLTNECDMWRLVSPNYNGQFEFNAAKNDGVSYFNINLTYKPQMPYIRVAPNFKGLYGSQFNDARGLICGGDFSLPLLTSAWTEYENTNKNFQIAFDRQIESLEFQNKWAGVSDITNAITGTATGAVSGAFTGSMFGGGYGAAAGAAVGGVASGAGGLADVIINSELRSEALDLTRDQFGYKLGNIRAMPNSLRRVSAFNINNKIFPIIEYYTCTDIEKEALKNKIKYNGMTIMRIDKIVNFASNKFEGAPAYIKAKLIRLENIADDFHTINEISNELFKGVYLP